MLEPILMLFGRRVRCATGKLHFYSINTICWQLDVTWTLGEGRLDKYPSRALPLLSSPSLPLAISPSSFPPLSSITIPAYPSTSFPSIRFLPSLFPSISFPFPLSVPPYNAYRVWGSAIAHPAGPGEARPPNALYAILSPKSAHMLKVSPTCTRRPYNINSCKF